MLTQGIRIKAEATKGSKSSLTICLRVIRNAWHFYYALLLVFKVVCGGFGIALLTP
ncbi:DUF3265 domain-containing protein [Vibrio coralliilyticus]|nr:DUF3265 domain-containing protein [Vibrio coralliilyticus]